MRGHHVLGSLLPLAAVLACGSSLDPETVSGVWYLQSYNDSTVPGIAVFRSGTDSSLITIDSVRLVLDDGSACSWLVDLADEAPHTTGECVWTLDADPDDILVTILGTFTLRGGATADDLVVFVPADNLLVFGRQPAGPRPFDPDPGTGL
jgi:hypothetical protein